MITNINTGLCHSRTQQQQPPYFVNWQENGQQQYRFFFLRFACEDFKNKLVKHAGEIVMNGTTN